MSALTNVYADDPRLPEGFTGSSTHARTYLDGYEAAQAAFRAKVEEVRASLTTTTVYATSTWGDNPATETYYDPEDVEAAFTELLDATAEAAA